MPETLAQKVKAKYPGVYDDLADTDLESKILAKYPGEYDDLPRTKTGDTYKGPDTYAGGFAQSVAETAGTFAKNLIPGAIDATLGAVLHPIDTAKGLYGQAKTLTEVAGIGTDLRGQVAAANRIVEGVKGLSDPATGGRVVGGLLGGAALGRMPAMSAKFGPAVKSTLTAPEAAAVEFGESRGIPLDLATKTGSKTARAAQKRVANSIGGEGTAEALISKQNAGLARVGGEIAEKVSPAYATPEQAGAGVTEGVRELVKTMSAAADDAYGRLRKVEALPEHAKEVQTAPRGSRTYQQLVKKLNKGGETVNRDDLYRLRQVETELDAMPFNNRMMREAEKGGGLEHVEGTGGAGASVYNDIQRVSGGSETRAEMQAAIRKTLETGEWTPSAKGALEVSRKRAKNGYQGPNLPEDTPLLGKTESVNLPVELTHAKKVLEPIYNSLKRQSELVPLMGDKARALVALDRLVTGPEHASVTTVDAVLSDLKAMSRADIPELRTQGQGLAATAVQALDRAVKDAVGKAGPEALSALEEGRGATIAKYQAGDVLETLKKEPVQAYRQMTAPQDSGIAFLRQVREMAPSSVPAVGRAALEELLGKATAEGGFQRAAGIKADWDRMGPETKRILYGEQVPALDRFFLLAKRIGENPNPSGTAHVNNVFNWASSVGSYPLAKLLYTPGGVKALTKVWQIKLLGDRVPAAVRTAAIAELSRAATSAGVDFSVPAVAGSEAETASDR